MLIIVNYFLSVYYIENCKFIFSNENELKSMKNSCLKDPLKFHRIKGFSNLNIFFIVQIVSPNNLAVYNINRIRHEIICLSIKLLFS